MSGINHPSGLVGGNYTVAPSQQELAGALNPYGGNTLPGAPDPFTQYDARLPGAPAWAGVGGYEQDQQRMPGAPDPYTGTYSPMLPGAPDPFAGYNPMLQGAPAMSVLPTKQAESGGSPIQPYQSQPGAVGDSIQPYQPQPLLFTQPLAPYTPQPHPQYDLPTGAATHDPHWM